MKFTDSFRRAGRSLRNAKGRTILTSLAIAVGAFTLTAAMAVGEGTRQYADDLIGDNINPQMLFIVADEELFTGGSQPGGGLQEYNPNLGEFSGLTIQLMSDEDIQELQNRDDLEGVTPIYDLAMQYMSFEDSDNQYVSSLAVYDPSINTEASSGSVPSNGNDLEKNEVIIPADFVGKLIEDGVIESEEDLIGKELTLTTASSAANLQNPSTEVVADGQMPTITPDSNPNNRNVTLRVAAVSTQAAAAMSGGDAILVSNAQAKEIAETATLGTPAYQRYMGVSALAAGDRDPQEVKEALAEDGYPSQTAEDLQQLIFTIVNILQGIVAGFGILALIASVFGIINTQYISVLERTQQIGLMKALGMRGRHVSRLFQLEAAWIGLLGGAIGAILAIVLGTLINPTVSEAIGFGEGSYLLVFQPIPILILIAALILIAMLAGYFPAKKASRLDPIEALRTE